MSRLLQRLIGCDVLVSQHDLGSAVFLGLRRLEVLSSRCKVALLSAVQCRLARLELLTRLFQGLLSGNVLVRQHDLLGAIFLSLCGLKVLRSSCEIRLLLAVERCLSGLERLTRLLQRLLCCDVLVRKHQVLSATQFVLRCLECLSLFGQRCGLTAVKTSLLGLERLTCLFKRLRGSDLFVGQHDLRGAVLLRLRGLELLCGLSERDLLGTIKLVLSGRELLLAFLQRLLVDPIQLGLRALEVLLRDLQRLLGLNALVSQCGLLCAIQLRLSSLEGLRGLVLLRRERLAANAFAGLELPLRGALARREGLIRLLQAKLVDLAGVELASLVDRLLVGQRAV